MIRAKISFFMATTACLLAMSAPLQASGEKQDPAGVEFFEKNIRPVLSKHCYGCHSSESGKQKGGLSLENREETRLGGESGHAVVPGNLKESLLLRAIRYEDPEMQMPPKKEGGKLPPETIAKFEQWIQMGAPDPREGPALSLQPIAKREWDAQKAKAFWAFQAPREHAVPPVNDIRWPRNDVDRFILSALEKSSLHPVSDASRHTLIRRVYLDLIGLPPQPEEVDAFLLDRSPQAFEKVVDRLLASPQFGERWGRHWLDVARYAESTGKERNFTYPAAWRYRDYVIHCFNSDKPYDAFIREQVAGDLLPHDTPAEKDRLSIATGFLALGPKGLNEKNKEQFKMDLIDEQIDTTTRAVLALTVGCARCHDHKFDPISQRDYYALAGIFESTTTFYGTAAAKKGGINRQPSSLIPLNQGKSQPGESAPESATSPSSLSTADAQSQKQDASLPTLPANLEARLKGKSPKQKQKIVARLQQRFGTTPPPEATNAISPTAAPKQPEVETASVETKGKRGRKKNSTLEASFCPNDDFYMGVQEGKPAQTRVRVRGEIDQPGESVPRGFVQILATEGSPAIPAESSGRLAMAQWLTSPENPLTARVAVNRVWQHLFGAGLVRTADNFGATGEKPSHPELLDTLAARFQKEGWSVKKLIRTLVLSRTYQLSGEQNAKALAVDPENHLLWRASLRRLDAEAIRDSMLSASGQLELKPPMGSMVASLGDGQIGRGIRPEIFNHPAAKHRSVYLPIVRDFVPDALDVFDFAEPSLVIASRDTTNVPSQALFLMNNLFVREQASGLAKRILALTSDTAKRLQYAFLFALGRPATPEELTRAQHYLNSDSPDTTPTHNTSADKTSETAWSNFCQALFASAEFRYVN